MTAAAWWALAKSYVRMAREVKLAAVDATPRRRPLAAATIARWLAHARDARDRARSARRAG